MSQLGSHVLPPSLDDAWYQRHEVGVMRSQTPAAARNDLCIAPSKLIGFGAMIKVHAPRALVQRMRKEAQRVSALYR